MNFSDWYAANVAPQVEEQLKSVRADARPMIRKASRDAMAACWNAAMDAASAEIDRNHVERIHGTAQGEAVTYTYAILEVSVEAYNEIRVKLEAASYQHAFTKIAERRHRHARHCVESCAANQFVTPSPGSSTHIDPGMLCANSAGCRVFTL